MADTINGRTPDEIKRRLGCLLSEEDRSCEDHTTCYSCPYRNEIYITDAECFELTLALIQQLEDHIGELTEMVQQLEHERDAAVAETESLNAEIDAINEDYLSGIHTVREDAQPKWISVEERLPGESVTVLVYRDGCCGVARLLDAEPEIMWTYTGFGGDPTHWMPLPEPPKEVT